ncbi:MAG: Ni/Fe hydrogenase subunit alpha [Ilumatobacter sp.]|uniref:Ni/Fe hydrogenase subunit alpha n=1 Tax=Ilumatobacter sp. TaxID=1967498 RepID=UPI0026105F5A|nr:Ni/Fe hydrogenase subunit alpha [Ilumatobacter sp.]MDJ0770091.1 Ni/Fe hydrogenase subunit alpha [Ilumatobacter sp.]
MATRETVMIDPVTRIEGHAKITIGLDEDGQVDSARFHVTEFRGFEAFCRGRPVWEMPSLTARTCGICPVSHLLASAKAGDAVMGVRIPTPGAMLRRVANLGQIIQSHALSFFHLSSPDFLLGWDADPAARNVFGLIGAEPELARRGIRLRSFGQSVIEAIAGRKVHSPGIVPGGIAHPMTTDTRDRLLAALDEAQQTAEQTLELFIGMLDRFEREVRAFGSFPSLHLGLANADGVWETYDGHLRFVGADGEVVADDIEPADYREYIGEAARHDSYLKSPYFKPLVGDDGPVERGIYRVGPLARLNVCTTMGSPLADEALTAYRELAGGVANSSFFYHYARLIEILACTEQMRGFLTDERLLDPMVRATAGINHRRAVGASEAPRGTLFHEYHVDEHGLLEDVNMIIATGQNNLGMNETVLQIAREWIDGRDIPEPVLNRVEAGIRAYDPCLSCSTHALGQMPLAVALVDHRGTTVAERRRG